MRVVRVLLVKLAGDFRNPSFSPGVTTPMGHGSDLRAIALSGAHQ